MDNNLTPEQIQEMQAKLASLQSERDQLAADKEEALKNADDAIKKVQQTASKDLDNVIAAAKKTAAELEKKAADLATENASLKKENNKLNPKPIVIEVGGKEYEFTSPSFHFNGKDYKASEIVVALDAISNLNTGDYKAEHIEILKTIRHLTEKAPGVLVEVIE